MISHSEHGSEIPSELTPSDVAADSHGTIYILDTANRRVLVFDSTGVRRQIIGDGRGSTAKLDAPAAIAVSLDGTLHVREMGKRVLARWDRTGRELQPLPINFPFNHVEFGIVGDRVVAAIPDEVPPAGRTRERLVVMQGGDVIPLVAFEASAPAMVQFRCANLPALPLFSPSLVWFAGGDRVAAATGEDYVVRIFERGRTRTVRRATPIRTVTREMALRELGTGMTISFGPGSRHCEISAAEALKKRGYAHRLPAVSALAIGPDGELWVRRGTVKGEPSVIDVFDSRSQYVGTLPSGSPFPIAFISRREIVAIEQEGSTANRLIVYHVISSR
jgi:hypothetical protein